MLTKFSMTEEQIFFLNYVRNQYMDSIRKTWFLTKW